MAWVIYCEGYNVGQAPTKHQVIKRLEKILMRFLNRPGDVIGKKEIKVGSYIAKYERF